MLLSNGSSLVFLLVNLGLKDTSLLSSSITTNESGVTVEVASDFLEGCVLGLNVEEPDEDKFGSEPSALSDLLAQCTFQVNGGA